MAGKIVNRSLKSSAAVALWWMRDGVKLFQSEEQATNRVVILCYHQIVADITAGEQVMLPGMVVQADTFRRQLEVLRESYDVVSLDDAAAILRGERQTTRPTAAITFDDGYRNVHDLAWPILRELGLTATVFLPTALIGTKQMMMHDRAFRAVMHAQSRRLSLIVPLVKAGMNLRDAQSISAEPDPLQRCDRIVYQPAEVRDKMLAGLDDFLCWDGEDAPQDWALMDWETVRTMAAGGIDFGAHTESHVVLTLEDEAVIAQEVRRSKQVLEAKLGRPITQFAYPNGQYNAAIKQALTAAGFDLAVTTERRVNRRGDDLLALGRYCLCEESTRGISGQYSDAVARLRLRG